MTSNRSEPLVVSEFEWESLEWALLNGLDHPLDELLEGRKVIVDRREEPRLLRAAMSESAAERETKRLYEARP